MELGALPPDVTNPIPGKLGDAWAERLAASECPAFTTRRKRREESTGASHDPIVWVEAQGSNVVDADGNRYVDLTSGFGVALLGHRHPKIVGAIHAQSERLIHALGDLHPSDVMIELLERLCALSPWPDTRAMLSLSGSDAVAAALKTAVMATGRNGVLAFDGSYHGLNYGPLAVSGYARRFVEPFAGQLADHVVFAPWPDATETATDALSRLPDDWSEIGAVIVEPIQGRAGVQIPPEGFLSGLRDACDQHGAILIADEVFTGLGRCGSWFQATEAQCVPDVVCLGKALGGGLPVSACIGRAEVMAAWGTPAQEAIHTGTFYGDPLGAAAALATLDVIEEEDILRTCRIRGASFAKRLQDASLPTVQEIRSAGLMFGLQLAKPGDALTVTRALLERGYLVLPAGQDANVVQLLPAVELEDALFEGFLSTLSEVLHK